MSDIEELERYYFEQTGSNLAFFDKHSIPKTELPVLLLLYDTSYYDIEGAIEYFIKDYMKIEPNRDSLYPHLKDFYKFYKDIFNNAKHNQFFELCANIYLDGYKIQPALKKYGEELFVTPIADTTFIDLCSGFNFYNFYDYLNKDTIYYLIDKSMFTCICLELGKKRKKIDNVVVLNTDIKDVDRKQIEGDVSVVRVNNVWGYTEDFHKYIEKYKSMIMQDGIFLFQEYSKDKILFIENGPYKVRNIPLYFDGWEQKYIINLGGGKIFDSLVYKKIPKK
jgi:hypothetical protein